MTTRELAILALHPTKAKRLDSLSYLVFANPHLFGDLSLRQVRVEQVVDEDMGLIPELFHNSSPSRGQYEYVTIPALGPELLL